jgi:hypothetical protein
VAEIDARIAHARRELLRLQDERRRGTKSELELAADLVPICADLLSFCAQWINDRLRAVRS